MLTKISRDYFFSLSASSLEDLCLFPASLPTSSRPVLLTGPCVRAKWRKSIPILGPFSWSFLRELHPFNPAAPSPNELEVKELKLPIGHGQSVTALISASLPKNLLGGLPCWELINTTVAFLKISYKTRLQLMVQSSQLGIMLCSGLLKVLQNAFY